MKSLGASATRSHLPAEANECLQLSVVVIATLANAVTAALLCLAQPTPAAAEAPVWYGLDAQEGCFYRVLEADGKQPPSEQAAELGCVTNADRRHFSEQSWPWGMQLVEAR